MIVAKFLEKFNLNVKAYPKCFDFKKVQQTFLDDLTAVEYHQFFIVIAINNNLSESRIRDLMGEYKVLKVDLNCIFEPCRDARDIIAKKTSNTSREKSLKDAIHFIEAALIIPTQLELSYFNNFAIATLILHKKNAAPSLKNSFFYKSNNENGGVLVRDWLASQKLMFGLYPFAIKLPYILNMKINSLAVHQLYELSIIIFLNNNIHLAQVKEKVQIVSGERLDLKLIQQAVMASQEIKIKIKNVPNKKDFFSFFRIIGDLFSDQNYMNESINVISDGKLPAHLIYLAIYCRHQYQFQMHSVYIVKKYQNYNPFLCLKTHDVHKSNITFMADFLHYSLHFDVAFLDLISISKWLESYKLNSNNALTINQEIWVNACLSEPQNYADKIVQQFLQQVNDLQKRQSTPSLDVLEREERKLEKLFKMVNVYRQKLGRNLQLNFSLCLEMIKQLKDCNNSLQVPHQCNLKGLDEYEEWLEDQVSRNNNNSSSSKIMLNEAFTRIEVRGELIDYLNNLVKKGVDKYSNLAVRRVCLRGINKLNNDRSMSAEEKFTEVASLCKDIKTINPKLSLESLKFLRKISLLLREATSGNVLSYKL